MKSLRMLVASILIFCACSPNKEDRGLPDKMPEDFNFVLKYGFESRDIVNTYENTYTKNMVDADDITIEMTLSDNDKQSIYNEMKAADILNSTEKASDVSCANPHEENKLTVTLNRKVYERKWITSYCNKKADHKLGKFLDFLHFEIIDSNEEYIKLPQPSGGYD